MRFDNIRAFYPSIFIKNVKPDLPLKKHKRFDSSVKRMFVRTNVGAGLQKIEHSLNRCILLPVYRQNDSFSFTQPGSPYPLVPEFRINFKKITLDIWK